MTLSLTINAHDDIVDEMRAGENLTPQNVNIKHRISLFFGSLLGLIAYGALYYTYVPRVLDLQLVLLPLVLVTVIVTANSIRNGTLWVVFLIPVGNSIPYFFGYEGFNPLFFIFYGFVLGVLLHLGIDDAPMSLKNPLLMPVIGASLVIIISAVVTFWRYTNFFPLHGGAVYELAVNVLNVSSGEALRRVLFDSLNYLGGFIWFVVLVNVLKAKRTIRWAVSLLAVSSLLSFAFGFYQSVRNMEVGNKAWFIQSDRINALFSDPNALGVFLVLSLPVFVGTLLARERLAKALFLAPVLVGIFLVPDSGSRVGMLGLAIAFSVFVFLLIKLGIYARKSNRRVWKSVMIHSAVTVIFLGLISGFVLLDKESNLHYRLSENIKSLKVLFKPRAREIILHGRHLTWPASLHMIRDYPVSGTGVGAYISELPNVYRKYDITPIVSSLYYREIPPPDIRVDSAGNHYLHVASEMGIIGLFFFGWIFYLVLRRVFRDHFMNKEISRWSFLGIGLSSSLLAMFVIFLLGAHTLHFEILLTFWLLVGLVYAVSSVPGNREPVGSIPLDATETADSTITADSSRTFDPARSTESAQTLESTRNAESPPTSESAETLKSAQASEETSRASTVSPEGKGPSCAAKAFVALLVCIFGVVFIRDSFTRLSLRERAGMFHLRQEFGLYQKETMDGRPFRWTGRAAGLTVKPNKPVVVVPVLASHPDIGVNPVKVKIFLTEDMFKSRRPLDEFELRGHAWTERRYDFADRIGTEMIMVFEISRTWCPKEVLDSPDPRHLGIAVGNLRFDELSIPDTSELERVKAKKPEKILFRFEPSAEEGEMGGKPPHITEWRIEASLPEGDFLFRLRSKGRAAGKEPPLAGLWIDGRLCGEDWIASDNWDDYCFRLKFKAGTREIRVAFMNEGYVAQTREYRKLFIESLEIIEK